MMYTYLLALGSNLGNREFYIEQAVIKLNKFGKVTKISPIIKTEPLPSTIYDTVNHTQYLNCVCEFSTSLCPCEVYKNCVIIEDELGHSREQKWQPRQMDIDILFAAIGPQNIGFAASTPFLYLDANGLQVPHSQFWQRDFLIQIITEHFNLSQTLLNSHNADNKNAIIASCYCTVERI